MTEALLQLDHIGLRRDERVVLQDVSLSLRAGEILTVIGPNGAGKTSLVRIALGLLAPDSGVRRARAALRVGYLPQKLGMNEALPLDVQRFLTLARPGLARAALEQSL